HLLVHLKVFNTEQMNQAVFAFRRYEDASLRYTGIESHEGLTHYGLYDTVVAREGRAARYWCELRRLSTRAIHRHSSDFRRFHVKRALYTSDTSYTKQSKTMKKVGRIDTARLRSSRRGAQTALRNLMPDEILKKQAIDRMVAVPEHIRDCDRCRRIYGA